jgi:large subunit ribosomal protein L29
VQVRLADGAGRGRGLMKRHDDLERLHNMSDEDLRAEAQRLKESLFRLNFKLALGEVDAVKTVRREKKTLARVQTLMRERQQAQATK